LNRCTRCNSKLSSRNKNKRKGNFTQLCAKCWVNPSNEERCIYTKKDGNRCKMRKSNKSDKYCGMHARKING